MADGRKDDSGKRRFDLMPWNALAEVADVLTFGALKYDDNNWQKVPNPRTRYFAAAQRHLHAWRMGQFADPETGRSHLAHAACCILFLLSFDVGHDPPSE
jgi:hypothetical protein